MHLYANKTYNVCQSLKTCSLSAGTPPQGNAKAQLGTARTSHHTPGIVRLEPEMVWSS